MDRVASGLAKPIEPEFATAGMQEWHQNSFILPDKVLGTGSGLSGPIHFLTHLRPLSLAGEVAGVLLNCSIVVTLVSPCIRPSLSGRIARSFSGEVRHRTRPRVFGLSLCLSSPLNTESVSCVANSFVVDHGKTVRGSVNNTWHRGTYQITYIKGM